MTGSSALLLRALHRSLPFAAASRGSITFSSALHEPQSPYTTTATAAADADAVTESNYEKKKGKWFTLPPFDLAVDGADLGKELARKGDTATAGGDATTTRALKWVLRCCPQLPRSLVQKLFRLRQV